MIKHSSSQHWYDKGGNPQHDANLRIARKSSLYPSVTTVDRDSFPNRFLEQWKLEQAIKAGIDNPRQPHESVEQYAQRVYELSNTKGRIAADFGHEIHNAIEKYPIRPEQRLDKWFDNFDEKFFRVHIYSTIAQEKVLIDPDIGVAGRTDFIGEGMGVLSGRVLADWKTQDVKVNDKGKKVPNFYDSWRRQLGFYGVADAKETFMFPSLPTCVSVIIDSNDDAGIYTKIWTNQEMVEAYEEFVAGAWLWFRDRNYWPNGGPWKIQDIPIPIAN